MPVICDEQSRIVKVYPSAVVSTRNFTQSLLSVGSTVKISPFPSSQKDESWTVLFCSRSWIVRKVPCNWLVKHERESPSADNPARRAVALSHLPTLFENARFCVGLGRNQRSCNVFRDFDWPLKKLSYPR